MSAPASAPVPPTVLTFAASDPSGGAGIQADLLTQSSMGCHALSVLTAITVQDTSGVEDVLPIDAEWVSEQARLLLEDMAVSAFKIGMVGSAENVTAIAEILADYPDVPVVFDPVLASGRGDELAGEDLVEAMRELLVPHATIVTPNSMEARRLAADEEREEDAPALDECAGRLLERGAGYVLITGTHENTAEVHNVLYDADGIVRSDRWERLPGSYHGSGCTLASAIAAALANGLDLPEAVHEAQEYTWQTLAAAFRPGMGQYIPDRFFWARANGSDDGDDDATAADRAAPSDEEPR